MLDLESRHEHAAATVRREHESDRPLGRDEREAGVVRDVLLVEEHAAREPALRETRRKRLASSCELLCRDPHAAAFSGRSSARRRRTRSSTFGCVTKSAARPCFEERVERPERLGRGGCGEVDELTRLFEPSERVGEPVRRLAQLRGAAVGLELALRREQQVHARGGDRAEHEEQPALEPAADAAQLDHRRCEHDHSRLKRDVVVLHVRELVREHSVELGGRTGGQEP